MGRNSDGNVERSTEDVTTDLNGLDQQLRARYGCGILLIHRIGHAVRDRARGPFALTSNTDANFLIARPDLETRVVIVKAGRMKHCVLPPPFELEVQLVYLDADDEKRQGRDFAHPKGHRPRCPSFNAEAARQVPTDAPC